MNEHFMEALQHGANLLKAIRLGIEEAEGFAPAKGASPGEDRSVVQTVEVQPEPPAEVKPDRDAIKAELEAMNIKYNNKCKTYTLAKLLEEEKAKVVEVVPEEVQPTAGACVACGGSGISSAGGPCVCQGATVAPAPASMTKEDALTRCRAAAELLMQKGVKGGAVFVATLRQHADPDVAAWEKITLSDIHPDSWPSVVTIMEQEAAK